MFEVEPMAKILVLCARKDLDAAVDSLYEFGAIHVTRSTTFHAGAPSARLEPVSRMLVKLRAVESALAGEGLAAKPEGGAGGSGARHEHSMSNGAAVEKEFEALGLGEFDAAAKRKQELEGRLNELRSREKELMPFKAVKLGVLLLPQSLELAVFDVVTDGQKALGKAREFGEAALLQGGGRQQPKLLVAWDKGNAEKARSALGRLGKEASLPQSVKAFDEDYAETVEGISASERELAQARRRLREYSAKHGARVAALRGELEVLFKKADLPAKFGQSELSASAEGWVERKRLHDLEKALSDRLDDRILIEHMHTAEMPPSKLKNLAAVRPFEFMVGFFSLPRYKEIDPTFVTALTFPLFFGMILGDLGYGLVLLLMGLALALKFRKGFLNNVGGMLVLSAISTMIFGWVYAEFFGAESVFGMVELHPMLSRIEEEGINALFALSILVGFAHLTLGFILGVWQGFREKHLKHAYAKLSWIFVLFGLTAFIANSMNLIFTHYLGFLKIISPPFDAGMFILGMAGVAYFEGVVQLLELPSLVANILSYLRIMALGLSGVALAGIIAGIPLELSQLATVGGFVSFVLFGLLVIVGHAVAIVLGLIEAGIQSLRLHYVEFYSKFYKGGGVQFVTLRED